MISNHRLGLLIWAGLLTPLIASEAQNWPHWRGPLDTGEAPHANPPVTWSEQENVRWKVALPGRGASTPVVWDQKVFIQTAIATGEKPEGTESEQGEGTGRGGRGGFGISKPSEIYQFVLLCLDRKTGQTLWQRVAREEVPHEGHHEDHGFASHSPITDGERVYSYFGSRGLHCYDMDGNPIWSKDLGRMETLISFGEGSSPTLHGEFLVINWDHQGEDFIAAFNKRTGAEVWRQDRDEPTSWATPIVVVHEGKAQVISSATSKVRSYDLASGELIWECGPLTANVIPSPVASEGMVYATSGFRGNRFLAIKLGGEGDLSETEHVVWTHHRQTPYVPSPLLYRGKLYFFSKNDGILSCLDARTGEVLIDAERLEGLRGVYSSPVGAGGRVYLLGRNGVTLVLSGSGELEVLATNELDDHFEASPAPVGDELFLRGQKSLYCISGQSG